MDISNSNNNSIDSKVVSIESSSSLSLQDESGKKRKIETISSTTILQRTVNAGENLISEMKSNINSNNTIAIGNNDGDDVKESYVPLSLNVGTVRSADEEIVYLLKQLEYQRQEKEEIIDRFTSYCSTMESMFRATINAVENFDRNQTTNKQQTNNENDDDSNNNNNKNDEMENSNENSNENLNSIENDETEEIFSKTTENEINNNSNSNIIAELNENDDNNDNNDDNDGEGKDNDLEQKLDNYFNVDSDDDDEDDDDFDDSKKSKSNELNEESDSDDSDFDGSQSSSSSSEPQFDSVGEIAERAKAMLSMLDYRFSTLSPCYPKPIPKWLDKPVTFI